MKLKIEPALMHMLQHTASKLQTRHFAWAIDAARAHFKKSIADIEVEIIRTERFGAGGTDAALTTRREEYRNIAAFLEALYRVVMQVSVEQGAREIADYFGWGKGKGGRRG